MPARDESLRYLLFTNECVGAIRASDPAVRHRWAAHGLARALRRYGTPTESA